MSMNSHAIKDTGLLLTPVVMAYVNLYADRDNVPDGIQELAENGTFQQAAENEDPVMLEYGYTNVHIIRDILEELDIDSNFICNFEGTATRIDTEDVIVEFSGSDVCYVPTEKAASIFNTGYNSLDEVVAEFKAVFENILPEDFDYKTVICELEGADFS